jgi:hypothetical protein
VCDCGAGRSRPRERDSTLMIAGELAFRLYERGLVV